MASARTDFAKNGSMQVLVLNGGSSSIKFSMIAMPDDVESEDNAAKSQLDGELTGVGTDAAKLKLAGVESGVTAASLDEAIDLVLEAVSVRMLPPDAVGHRVVHPGAQLRGHQRITPEVLNELEQAVEFAPLHDPEALHLIRAAMKRYPDCPHYACFDTVFHETMPEEATIYPLPAKYRDCGVRRYGFHGLSCESIVRQLRASGEVPSRMVIAHLGSGCSVTALVDGRSIDTTMGLTPTGGVLMGTRSGDLDPGLVLYLLRQQGAGDAIAAVETMLNHASGMLALSGMANDVRAMRAAAVAGNREAELALKVFTRSITKAIGGFSWLLGGLDAIVFAGGIGEHDAQTRGEILHGLGGLGVAIEETLPPSAAEGIERISSMQAKIKIFIVPAQEDLMIALHVASMAQSCA